MQKKAARTKAKAQNKILLSIGAIYGITKVNKGKIPQAPIVLEKLRS